MGRFNRGKAGSRGSPSSLQIPDELAQRAHIQYGSSNFMSAVDLYSQAVDKLHTMYVVGECKHRQPSQSDAPIIEGLVSAVGAAGVSIPARLRARLPAARLDKGLDYSVPALIYLVMTVPAYINRRVCARVANVYE